MSWMSFARQNGVLSVFEECLARLNLWDLSENQIMNVGSGSSFSDNEEYLSIVLLAASDDAIFRKFRANRQYRKILEHVPKSLGSLYLDAMKSNGEVMDKISNLHKCDSVGGPIRYRFKNLGFYSPTTIRYVYFHTQMEKLFGDLTGLRVIEIGGGFGGQAAVSTTINTKLKWTIFDLPEVTILQQKYLAKVNPDVNVIFSSGLEIKETYGDILLSNYALSEISRELQLEYLNKVVLNCERGYMAWNTISELQGGGLTLAEVLDLIPGSRAEEESPLSSEGNKIVFWG